jgi:hypothetical protein
MFTEGWPMLSDDPASWTELWIAGFDGTMLGYGPTPQLAVEDASDFCNSSAYTGFEVTLASPEVRERVLSRELIVVYVVRDGMAYTY